LVIDRETFNLRSRSDHTKLLRFGGRAAESRLCLFLSRDLAMKQAHSAAETEDALETIESDYEAYTASTFRDDWMAVWSRMHGSFEDTSESSLLHCCYCCYW